MILTAKISSNDIIETMTDSLLLLNQELNIIDINPSTLALLEQNKDNIVGKNITEFFPDEQFFNHNNFENIRNHEIKYIKNGNKTLPLSLSSSIISDKNKQIIYIVIILRDITSTKETEDKLTYSATHDYLTDLPNRILLHDRIRQAIARARRYRYYIGILLLDLDHFKEVNDTFGHDAGDKLLIEAGKRIKSCIREYDTVARIGGDEFIVILSDLRNEQDAATVGKRILDKINTQFKIQDHELEMSASIGISIYPLDGDNIESLLKDADMAMYTAKEQGRNRLSFFSYDMSKVVKEQIEIKNDLQKAIKNQEFILYYQPLFELNSEKITCLEALIRWQHPESGIIPPLKFISVAESSGLILQIGEWVLKTACKQIINWHNEGLPLIPICINISSRQLYNKDFIELITDVLKESHLPPEYLILEITESTAMQTVEDSMKIITSLHNFGVNIFIDDFGSGYSSLNWLKKLPIQALKIDRFFIQHIVDDSNDATMVQAIIAMAHNLKIKVIAEGVETLEQLNCLKSMKWNFETTLQCDQIQGFLLSKPIPENETKKLLIKNLKK